MAAETNETADPIIEPIAGTQSINRGERSSRGRDRKFTVMPTEVYTRLRAQMNKANKY